MERQLQQALDSAQQVPAPELLSSLESVAVFPFVCLSNGLR